MRTSGGASVRLHAYQNSAQNVTCYGLCGCIASVEAVKQQVSAMLSCSQTRYCCVQAVLCLPAKRCHSLTCTARYAVGLSLSTASCFDTEQVCRTCEEPGRFTDKGTDCCRHACVTLWTFSAALTDMHFMCTVIQVMSFSTA